jgi:putative PIN family toxin of toxin-antitoxin system
VRAVLDVNVLISAVISGKGAPAGLVLRWLNGEFELVVSEKLWAELSRAVAYPKILSRVGAAEATAFIQLLRATATVAVDPQVPHRRSRDPGDDYLVALAESEAAMVVSGDDDLLVLREALPVLAPADFLKQLRSKDESSESIQ